MCPPPLQTSFLLPHRLLCRIHLSPGEGFAICFCSLQESKGRAEVLLQGDISLPLCLTAALAAHLWVSAPDGAGRADDGILPLQPDVPLLTPSCMMNMACKKQAAWPLSLQDAFYCPEMLIFSEAESHLSLWWLRGFILHIQSSFWSDFCM